MSALHYYLIVVADPDPQRRIAGLSDGHLDALIEELAQVTHPNPIQADIFARAMHEVLRRWRGKVKG